MSQKLWQHFRFKKKCHKNCGKNFILKKMPQKVWQKNYFEKNATKKCIKKHLTGFKNLSGVKKVFLKENYACGAS